MIAPMREYTVLLLKLLKERNLKASFFVIGEHAEKYHDLLLKIIHDGHDVMNHSYNHWKFEKYNLEEQISDMAKLDSLLPKTGSFKKIPFRPPRGKLSLSLFFKLISMGRQVIYWSYDSKDYLQEGEEYLLGRFDREPVKAGDIILFHDDNSYTLNALPVLLDKWISAGFDIQPISKML